MSTQKDNETLWQPVKPASHDQPTISSLKTTTPIRPLTRKQKAFVQELITNPKQSAAAAARKTYQATTDRSARQIATENLAKPGILNELAKHSATAEYSLVEVLNHSKQMMYEDERRGVDWAVNTRQTADSVLDRIHGKATQKIEQHSTTVTLSLSLKDITSDTTTTTGASPDK